MILHVKTVQQTDICHKSAIFGPPKTGLRLQNTSTDEPKKWLPADNCDSSCKTGPPHQIHKKRERKEKQEALVQNNLTLTCQPL